MGLTLENKDMVKEVENRVYKIRDLIVTILFKKSLEDVTVPDGKLELAKEIKNKINEFLSLGTVEDVYFTDFEIQYYNKKK